MIRRPPRSTRLTPSFPTRRSSDLRRAITAVAGMRRKLEAVEARSREPIAIVGMACRFPGSPDLESYWRLLEEGRDAITKVPRERWDVDALYDPEPAAPGKMSSHWGGLGEGVQRSEAVVYWLLTPEGNGKMRMG